MDAENTKRDQFAGNLNVCTDFCHTVIPTIIFSASIKAEHENEKHMMEEKFRERLYQVSEEFSAELTTNKEELQARHKKQLGKCVSWI